MCVCVGGVSSCQKHAFSIARPLSSAPHGEGGVTLTWVCRLSHLHSLLPFKQSNVWCSSSGGDKVISMFLSPSFSSEDPKKPATDAQGDQSLTCPHLILWKWMEADHVYTGLCVCCVYLCLHHTLHGTQYVWWHASAPSLQLFPLDAPQPRLVPSPHLAGLAAALPSLCVRPNLEWRIQLVSNLLTVSDSGSGCGPVM